MPVVQDIPHRPVQPLRQAAADAGHSLLVGDGAPVHADPLHRTEQLPADELIVRRVGDEAGGVALGIEADEHPAHVEYNVFDHTMDTFPLLALNTTMSKMPLVTVKIEAREAAVPTELRTILV